MQPENKKFVEIVGERLKLTPADLREVIYRLAEVINYENRSFVTGMANLGKKLSVFPDRGQFWHPQSTVLEFNLVNMVKDVKFWPKFTSLGLRLFTHVIHSLSNIS